MFKVVFKRKVEKAVEKLPPMENTRFYKLVEDLKQNGPVRKNWPKYSMLKGTNTHHCHLSYHWVACWVETETGIKIEVTYAGSRESSPYA